MKKVLIICGLLFSVMTFAQAQDGGRKMPSPEERAQKTTERLAEKLSLTEDQKTKVSAIYLEQANAMVKLREEKTGDREAMRAAMTKSNEDAEAKVNALLNDDQKKTFAAWKVERQERMKKMGNGGPGRKKDK